MLDYNNMRNRLTVARRFLVFVVIVLSLLSLAGESLAQTGSGRFDISYIWHSSIDGLLDYKDEVEKVLGAKVAAKLRIVKRGNLYGLVYDRDGGAASLAQIAAAHSKALSAAGLEKAEVIKDKGYHELYNVSYGMGRNLEALKKQYSRIYSYLGKEVGKKLFIEQTDSNNYTLIYRRQGDRKSSLAVARRHAKLLKRKRILTSITRENNNEVVFGESSLLDKNEASPVVAVVTAPVRKEIKPVPVFAVAPAAKVELIPDTIKVESPKKSTSVASQPDKVEMSSPNSELSDILNRYIKGLRDKGAIARDESTAWLVYDLTTGRKLVDINEDISFQAASMIKPFVALAFFHQVKEGKLIYGPKSRRNMERMIQRSSNSSTNWVMRSVGGPVAVQNILKKYYGNLFKNTKIVEYIPANGQTYRNMAAPGDYNLFLNALWREKIPHAKELRRLMALPGHDRLYHGTVVPQGTLVYNKTGSTAHLCGDMGILAPQGVDGHRYPYTIIGIIEKKSRASNYGRWMMARGNVIRQVSNLVYNDMRQRYSLLE